MTDDFRILVTGSREWDDAEVLDATLRRAVALAPPGARVVIVHGACPTGADTMADGWARGHGLAVERFPADWDHYGRAAGMIRNGVMVDAGANLCTAFFKQGAANRGTAGCVRLARLAEIPLWRITARGLRMNATVGGILSA